MNSILYQLKSFDKFYKILAKKEKHNRFLIFCDYVFSMFLYGASASDYFDFEFYKKKHSVRNKYVCWKLKKQFMHTVNDYSPEKNKIFNEKTEFLKCFDKFIGRDWLDTSVCSFEEFCVFIKKHPSFIIKPSNMSQGKGIKKETVDDSQDLQLIFENYKNEKMLLEELIIQHPRLNDLYPGSVNTARIAAVNCKGELVILGTCLRLGSGGSVTDNFSAGGLSATIDKETGIITSDGYNHLHDTVEKHPDTNETFRGFEIPFWQEAIAMIKEASTIVEGVNYIGWDVAFTEKGPVLVEGNFEGMFHAIQSNNNYLKKDVLKILNIFRNEKGA